MPFHSVLPVGADSATSLDARRDGGASLRRLSPHDLMQRYLNLPRSSLWGMVTDGVRLLRDYHHCYTRRYAEFDLQEIFFERDFAAFRVFYRRCHASRFLPMLATAAVASMSRNRLMQPSPGDGKRLWQWIPGCHTRA